MEHALKHAPQQVLVPKPISKWGLFAAVFCWFIYCLVATTYLLTQATPEASFCFSNVSTGAK